jgi:hypothetical protein
MLRKSEWTVLFILLVLGGGAGGARVLTGPPATRTDALAGDVLSALRNAGVPESALKMVAAQSALETSGWVGGLWNWNLGNLTQPDVSKPYVMQPGNALPFATFASLAEGAKAFVDHLTRTGVIQFASSGDLPGYVAALKKTAYAGTSANYDAYQAGMATWMSKL